MSATLIPPPPRTEPTTAPAQQGAPANGDESIRQRAIKRIQHRRRFQFDILVSAIVMLIVAAIWAIVEYNNAGGWPTDGFSQSSGIHDVWNMWILYPFIGWVAFLALRSWAYFGGRSITESDIQREIERQTGRR